jgi:hypothetical protein
LVLKFAKNEYANIPMHFKSYSVASSTMTNALTAKDHEHALGQWQSACQLFDKDKYDQALWMFEQVHTTAKVLYNQAVCMLRMESLNAALQRLRESTDADPFLVPALALQAFIELHLKSSKPVETVTRAMAAMRDSNTIDYAPMGLNWNVSKARLMFIRAHCLYDQNLQREAVVEMLAVLEAEPSVKDDVVSWLVSHHLNADLLNYDIFRPTRFKLATLTPNDYLGTAVLMSLCDESNECKPLFVKCMRDSQTSRWIERHPESLSMSSLKTLVKERMHIPGNFKLFSLSTLNDNHKQLLVDDHDLKEAIRDSSQNNVHRFHLEAEQ